MSNHILTQDGRWVTIRDDELYHWKYIKREKVGNKWRYYYHDDDVEKAKSDYETASKKANTHTKEIAEREKTVKAMDDILSGKISGTTTYKNGVVTNTTYSKETAQAIKNTAGLNLESDKQYGEYLNKEAQKAKKTYDEAYAVYKQSAGHKVADFLNDSSDKINKAKSWISGLFKKKNK